MKSNKQFNQFFQVEAGRRAVAELPSDGVVDISYSISYSNIVNDD